MPAADDRSCRPGCRSSSRSWPSSIAVDSRCTTAPTAAVPAIGGTAAVGACGLRFRFRHHGPNNPPAQGPDLVLQLISQVVVRRGDGIDRRGLGVGVTAPSRPVHDVVDASLNELHGAPGVDRGKAAVAAGPWATLRLRRSERRRRQLSGEPAAAPVLWINRPPGVSRLAPARSRSWSRPDRAPAAASILRHRGGRRTGRSSRR